MKNIWSLLLRKKQEVANHQFFTWLNSDEAPIEKRFWFSPVLVDFIMGFSDMNKYFLSYENPCNELEKLINEHTKEDRTHSLLFYEDWHKLNLRQLQEWSPQRTLWWLFLCKETQQVRQFGMNILDLSVQHQNPLIRFSMMEAIEICGEVFFENTAKIADKITAKTNIEHLYFGQYHRLRETGHLHTEEDLFFAATLNPEERAAAEKAVCLIYENFLTVLDSLLSYSQQLITKYHDFEKKLEVEYKTTLGHHSTSVTNLESSRNKNEHITNISSTQSLLVEKLSSRQQQLSQHKLIKWLKNSDTVKPGDKLRKFIALWGVDIVGYRDFNEIVLRYPEATEELQQEINQWTQQLASHAALYLQDWDALGMNHLIRWDSGEVIAFYFLSPEIEIHRSNMAKVKKHAFANPEPVIRWWLMNALESGGLPLFEATAPVACLAEAAEGIVLNYWADRHYIVESHKKADARRFLRLDISEEQQNKISAIIDTVFDNLEEQFSLSYQITQTNVFLNHPAALIPPKPNIGARNASALAR